MRLRSWALGMAALLAVTVAAPSAALATSAPVGSPMKMSDPRVIATFPPELSSFAESMVADRAGNLYVSVTTWISDGWNEGQVWKITPSGQVRKFGPMLSVGILSGLAIDTDGRLYAGLVAWSDTALPELLPGVVRIGAQKATRVLTLPGGEYASFPNGLAFSGDTLYVSDSIQGSIWRTRPHGNVNDQPDAAWLTSPLLAPGEDSLGVNGIAVDRNGIVAVNADTGSVIRIPLTPHGGPGPLAVIAHDPKLVTADGVTFDRQHRLWAVTNSMNGLEGSLLRVDPNGHVTTVANKPSWLNYPTQPVFGTAPDTRDTLFIANGAFNAGIANVIALGMQDRDHG